MHDRLLRALQTQGWSVADDALPASLAQELRLEALKRWQEGLFHPAHIGSQLANRRDAGIRGDNICWLEAGDPHPSVAGFYAWAAQLQSLLNREFFLGLKWLECQFARYDCGAGYARHVDQHTASPARKISVVLYFNPDWQPAHGGELCLYEPDSPNTEIMRIEPRLGRLAVFRSDTIPHAVLPSLSERWSLTGWFRSDHP
jgi:SM-20-related protein